MLELIAAPRAPKELKKEGFIPAVFYGAKTVSTPIFISVIDFLKVFGQSGEMSTISLKTEAGIKNVLVQAIQRNPVKSNITHVDFYVVEKGQKVHVAIPLNFVGEAPATKTGGVLVKVAHELMVEGESQNLPHTIDIDLGMLTTASSVITVKDITLPKGAMFYHVNEDDVLASISAQSEENLDEVVEVDLSAIEVMKKGKKEDAAEVPAE
jgi:large subunit ribosomal protein L25